MLLAEGTTRQIHVVVGDTFLRIIYMGIKRLILAQPVASPIADPGVLSLIPAQSITFVEIIRVIILRRSFSSFLCFEKDCSYLQAKQYVKYWLTAWSKLPVRLTDCLGMTIVVDWDIKPQTEYLKYFSI